MNGELDTCLRDIADDLKRSFSGYPEQSPDYTILMQDLSKQPAKSRPLLPGHVKIGTDPMRRNVYKALRLASADYQRIFIVHYLVRWKRPRKMDALDCSTKTAFYQLRDNLHSYLEGIITATVA